MPDVENSKKTFKEKNELCKDFEAVLRIFFKSSE